MPPVTRIARTPCRGCRTRSCAISRSNRGRNYGTKSVAPGSGRTPIVSACAWESGFVSKQPPNRFAVIAQLDHGSCSYPTTAVGKVQLAPALDNEAAEKIINRVTPRSALVIRQLLVQPAGIILNRLHSSSPMSHSLSSPSSSASSSSTSTA